MSGLVLLGSRCVESRCNDFGSTNCAKDLMQADPLSCVRCCLEIHHRKPLTFGQATLADLRLKSNLGVRARQRNWQERHPHPLDLSHVRRTERSLTVCIARRWQARLTLGKGDNSSETDVVTVKLKVRDQYWKRTFVISSCTRT